MRGPSTPILLCSVANEIEGLGERSDPYKIE